MLGRNPGGDCQVLSVARWDGDGRSHKAEKVLLLLMVALVLCGEKAGYPDVLAHNSATLKGQSQ